MTQEKELVYLNDGSLLAWEIHNPMHPFHLDDYDGYTRPIKKIGMDIVNENFGKYTIVASAVKYLADVVRNGGKCPGFVENGEYTNQKNKEIVFDGGIIIYDNTASERFPIANSFQSQTRDIWTANPNLKLYGEPDGLKNLIVGSNPIQNIEAIINGYKAQDQAKYDAELSNRHSSWQEGRRSARFDLPHWLE